jgi:hypothetical protein
MFSLRLILKSLVPYLGRSGAAGRLAAHDDAALGEAHFFADLRHLIPSRLLDRRRDELGAEVALAEELFVHDIGVVGRVTCCSASVGDFEEGGEYSCEEQGLEADFR